MSLVISEDNHVKVVEPAKEEPKEEATPHSQEFIVKRRSMEMNEFRRPSMAELAQLQLEEQLEEVQEQKAEDEGETDG